MKCFSSIDDLQDHLQAETKSSELVAFVPTMGNLHEGHLSLCRLAREKADIVVVSIFVNPLQFGPNEDLDKYPRTLEEDKSKLLDVGVDALFTPRPEDIYPEGMEVHTQVCVPRITQYHCGSSRPGHFDGVSTIVTKLFNIVQPDIAIFGQKDFQQLAVIRKMTQDLCIPVEIIGAPTSRDEDGLALSSRNQYLSDSERKIAPLLYKTLKQCQHELSGGNTDIKLITLNATKTLEKAGFRLDYLNLCDARTLEPITDDTREIVILAAAFLGTTRLIDNLTFPLNRDGI